MSKNIRTIKDIKLYLNKELIEIYPQSEINALSSIILMTVLKVSRLHVFAMPEDPVSGKQVNEIINICRELKNGKPLQYILGGTSFYNCRINLNPDVFIPRPETEELVDLIIRENRGFTGTILDAGTGSGCIAIALAVNLPGTKVTGIDINEGAIKISKENAILNKANVSFFTTDIFNPDPGSMNDIQIIVSNPPYIRESEKKRMSKNVLDYEPHTALFVSDSDPLVYYRAILTLAETTLIPEGKIYFEINEAMGEAMVQLLEGSGYSGVRIIKDINGKERIIKGNRI
jgi:release factor glutamine methyltransferase